MPVVKGGVWTNVEDEVLKAAVSKYGLNQWARVSSLLARKTPKQCKARWSEWIDPGIRKVEFSKEEDEKLLTLAKILPQQWRTIGPMIGRTANQSLQRYQQLLDDAEARESSELGLAGPGDEALAPSADSVRRLRPNELDPDPESKPAKPDTIDLDEDEKEMLSEARARLANTQGKKAKRKARERQLEESRRLALLQKRRELKNAGINIKINNRKKGQMDYNADIPFEKPPVPGFYDTKEEMERNDREREKYDPRKQQLAIKRKGEQDEEPTANNKRQKGEKDSPSAGLAAAMKAGQMQKIREAEQNSKRRALVLPAPQVGESELEDIVKMGMAGERAGEAARQGGENTRSLVGSYTSVVGEHSGPIRTPRAPPQEDHIANQIRDIKAMTETQSSLLGGENTPLHEGLSAGSERAKAGSSIVTPNPMATPYRQTNGISSTPQRAGPGATPLRTPRDNFSINQEGSGNAPGATPRELKLQERAAKSQLRSQLAALPKPKMTEWELELPEEQKTAAAGEDAATEEDATERDRRSAAVRKAQEEAEFKRRSQAIQKGLPVPPMGSLDALRKRISSTDDPVQNAIYAEMIQLITDDNAPPGRQSKRGHFSDEEMSQARLEIQKELSPASELPPPPPVELLPLNAAIFPQLYNSIEQLAENNNAVEKKLALHLGGYQQRAKSLRQKITEAAQALQATRIRVDVARTAQIAEEAAIASRLEQLREEVTVVNKRERETQEKYRMRREELESLGVSLTNGVH